MKTGGPQVKCRQPHFQQKSHPHYHDEGQGPAWGVRRCHKTEMAAALPLGPPATTDRKPDHHRRVFP
jgi:hypothetical protein